jgi:hypothetical protein
MSTTSDKMPATEKTSTKKRKTATATAKKAESDKSKYALTDEDREFCSTLFCDWETDDCITLPSAEEAFSFVLTFGRHKGESISEVMKTKKGRSYLKYVLEKWDALLPEQAIMIEFALGAWREHAAQNV